MRTTRRPRCDTQGLPEGGAFGRGHPVPFGVQVPPDLHGVAGLPLLDVLVHGGLQQVGVLPLGLPDAQHALVGVLHEHGRLGAAHVRPHLLEHGDLGALSETRANKVGSARRGGRGELVHFQTQTWPTKLSESQLCTHVKITTNISARAPC